MVWLCNLFDNVVLSAKWSLMEETRRGLLRGEESRDFGLFIRRWCSGLKLNRGSLKLKREVDAMLGSENKETVYEYGL